MTRALAHRGPDGEGIWHEGAVAFGHRRLAIRGLGDEGRQPMSDPENQVVVTYNGEIYNDEELRREIGALTGYRFRTACDTEVLVAGWLAWGEGLFERLEGMFAIGLWDRRRATLVLARDAAGIKPLFLARGGEGGTVAFASEIKGLLPGLARRPAIDPERLHVFLAQGHAGPCGTLLQGVEQVAPGTFMVLDQSGQWRSRRFWKPVRRPDIHRLDDAVGAFTEVWRRVLPSLLVSDVPVGVLQSGGIDSSLVSMAVGRSGMPAFVASFAEASHDETVLAERVARSAGAILHRVPVDVELGGEATFGAVVSAFDGQVADASAFAVHRLCGEVRRHVTVALSGDGADEFFAGYQTYAASALARRLGGALPAAVAAAAGRLLARFGGGDERRLPPHQVAARFLMGLGGPEPHCEWRRLVPGHLLSALYGPAMAPLIGRSPLSDYAAAVGGGPEPYLDRCLLADQRYYLPGALLMKVDAMSMAHGLEIRVPFLTKAVMEVAGRIDAAVLYPRGGPPKAPLRRALDERGLGGEITGGAKRGFNVPVDRLLRGTLASLGERLLVKEADRLGAFFSPAGLAGLWREHRERRRSWGYALWPLLTFATWFEGYER